MAHSQVWYVVSALCARTFIVALFLLVGFRLLGKRSMGQMQLYDLAMIMAVANGVQNAMTNGSGLLLAGLGTATTLVLFGVVLTKFFLRVPRLEEHLAGSPTLLVNNGKIIEDHLRRERVSRRLLMAAVRAHGLSSLTEVKMAVLEVDGSLSVVEQDQPSEQTSI